MHGTIIIVIINSKGKTVRRLFREVSHAQGILNLAWSWGSVCDFYFPMCLESYSSLSSILAWSVTVSQKGSEKERGLWVGLDE